MFIGTNIPWASTVADAESIGLITSEGIQARAVLPDKRTLPEAGKLRSETSGKWLDGWHGCGYTRFRYGSDPAG